MTGRKKCERITSKRKPSGNCVEAIGTAFRNKVARQRIRTALYRNKLPVKNPLPLGKGSVKYEQKEGKRPDRMEGGNTYEGYCSLFCVAV